MHDIYWSTSISHETRNPRYLPPADHELSAVQDMHSPTVNLPEALKR